MLAVQPSPLISPPVPLIVCPRNTLCPFTALWEHVHRSNGYRHGVTARAPPPRPVGTAFTEASGCALEVHDNFWAEVLSDQRRKLITDFTGRAKQAGVSAEVTKASARDLGVETPDYKPAAHGRIQGFEWVQMDWAGPRWAHIPNMRPEWAAKAREAATGPEEVGAKASEEEDEEPPYERLDPRSLRKLQKWRGAPRRTEKLSKLIGRHWTGEETEAPGIPAKEVWQVMLKCDAQG